MKKKQNIPFSKPAIGKEEKKAVQRVLNSSWLTTGKEALAFEEEFCFLLNVKHSLTVNSATSGLHLAFEACGIKEGTKIITSPYTFISTASPAIHLGAEIAYCDIEKDSYNIDPEKIEDILKKDIHQKKIKAIVPIHIAGNPCNMKDIRFLANKYGVYIIEDAAHALPSITDDGWLGTLGDIGVFSFYATKTITTGEGGMVVTKNDELAQRMKTMRLHGIDRPVWDRYSSPKASWLYDVVEAGYKYNLPDILAAIGREQLKKTFLLYEQRKEIVDIYNAAFAHCDWIIPPPDGTGNAWHLYFLQLDLEKLTIDRDSFALELQENGVSVSVHFIPHYHMSYWKKRGLEVKDFPESEKKFNSTLSLPLWPGMTKKMANFVIDRVKEIGEKAYVR